MDTLKQALTEWTDWDGATFCLARCLGLMGPEVDFPVRAKHVFWSNNPVGNMLHEVLKHLIGQGILEVHPEDDTIIRWNSAFVGSWEREWRPDNTA